MRILLVEDDSAIAEPLAGILAYEGFEVICHATAAGALSVVADVDLVLLDLGLPDIDGIEVCRRIRAGSDVPIIVVTARGDETERVRGLELGADDYVVKPFSQSELVARVRAVLRRRPPSGNDEWNGNGNPVTVIGALMIDRRSRRVTLDQVEIALTAKEFDILALLAANRGGVLKREQIRESVWGSNWYGTTKTVDAHVAGLRRKLGQAEWIAAVRSVGFRLEEPTP